MSYVDWKTGDAMERVQIIQNARMFDAEYLLCFFIKIFHSEMAYFLFVLLLRSQNKITFLKCLLNAVCSGMA